MVEGLKLNRVWLFPGIHPTIISESFTRASQKVVEFLEEISTPVQLDDQSALLRAASTSLNSKVSSDPFQPYFSSRPEYLILALSRQVVSQYSSTLAPIAVDAVKRLVATDATQNVDLRDIRLIKKIGGTVDDTELLDGVGLQQNVVTSAGGPIRIEKAKIGLLQFQLSAPKPDVSVHPMSRDSARLSNSHFVRSQMDNQVVVTDYRQMDKILKEERQYLLNLCKTIKKSGCNVLLLQKSILRDAVNDLSLHFLAKLKIMVVKDVERDEIDFLSKSLGCKPIADIEGFTEDKLGQAELVDEVEKSGAKVVRITGVKNPTGRTQSVLLTGANNTVLDESERSLHDALCVVRCLVQKRALIAGGGAPEVHVSRLLAAHSQTLKGMEAYCHAAFAEALEVIPTTLAENAGLNPIAIVTELRNRHSKGDRSAGINVRKGLISNIVSRMRALTGVAGSRALTYTDPSQSSRRTSCNLFWVRPMSPLLFHFHWLTKACYCSIHICCRVGHRDRCLDGSSTSSIHFP